MRSFGNFYITVSNLSSTTFLLVGQSVQDYMPRNGMSVGFNQLLQYDVVFRAEVIRRQVGS